jgi:hypothetical protein
MYAVKDYRIINHAWKLKLDFIENRMRPREREMRKKIEIRLS